MTSGEPPENRAAPPGVEIERRAGDPPSPWEAVYGYSRTVVVGPWIVIGGTTSVDPSGFVVGTTPYEQTVEILRKLQHELDRVGCSLGAVVQTRIYVTDISRAEEVGRAHGVAFADSPPVTSMVEVAALLDPRMLVEIELLAYRG